MGIISLFLIAVSLSFDSFAVSVCSGLSMCRKSMKITDSIKIAASLAIFQAGMPVLGWFLGSVVQGQIEVAGSWIAFILLLALGGHMIFEGTKPDEKKKIKNPTHWKVIVSISLATSIDAFAVGIGFSFFYDNILLPALLIGIVTFIVSMIGINIGKKTGKKLASKAEVLGGIILIAIGVKILIEHLYF
jgi:manganese efflux pump family protein